MSKGKGDNPYRRPDAFTKAAKARGFPARSVFKLEEIDARVRILRRGQSVLDLGAAPGSWSMFASQKVGLEGRVLSVDLTAVTQALGPNVTFLQGDALSLDNKALATFAPYDVVVSDMAPATSGSKVADQARSYELVARATEVARALLKPGGAFVAKIFMSPDYEVARKALRELFDDVRTLRPEGIRSSSVEVFLVALGRKAPPAAAP